MALFRNTNLSKPLSNLCQTINMNWLKNTCIARDDSCIIKTKILRQMGKKARRLPILFLSFLPPAASCPNIEFQAKHQNDHRWIKGTMSQMADLEKIGQFFQVCRSQSVLIFLSRNHPCSFSVYCHLRWYCIFWCDAYPFNTLCGDGQLNTRIKPIEHTI